MRIRTDEDGAAGRYAALASPAAVNVGHFSDLNCSSRNTALGGQFSCSRTPGPASRVGQQKAAAHRYYIMRRKCLVTDRQPNMRQTTSAPSRRRVLQSRWISRSQWQAIVHSGKRRIGKYDVEVEATQLRLGELEAVNEPATPPSRIGEARQT